MSTKDLPTDYQTFIAQSRYARWLPEEGRRETWSETVDRYCEHILARHLDDKKVINECRKAILNLEVMPSMRALMTAGAAADRDNTCIYNCSYIPVDHPRAFDELMFILLCGTGVGYSVEHQYTSKLPLVPADLVESDDIIVVKDSKEGWAKSFRKIISLLYAGEIPKWDVSKVRPAGARLKTFGGRASGSAPLVSLFEYTVEVFKESKGLHLTPYQVHCICCKIAEVIVVGGVRRSAMISLSDLDDRKMQEAKMGSWYIDRPHMALANNSAAYEQKPDMESFLEEWTALVKSKSGERGIFNREAARATVERSGRRDPNYQWGCNPCSEILLRGSKLDANGNPVKGTGGQFCNLTEIVVREDDTLKSLKRKARIATIMGTVQSMFTYMPYLRPIWRKNTEEERLLGVSMTGVMDNELTANPTGVFLNTLRDHCIMVNRDYADMLGIPASHAITCVKPSGTVSALVASSSGLHPSHSQHYLRTVRGDNKDPLTQFMIDQGIPSEPCAMKPETTQVFTFPMKTAPHSVTRKDLSAVEHLDIWKTYALEWCEHKPSVTISVKQDEWLEVGHWVYENFDICSGVSFLPYSDHTYAQAPFQECSEEDYIQANAIMPESVDWSMLGLYEDTDNTSGSQTMACSGTSCEIVDINA